MIPALLRRASVGLGRARMKTGLLERMAVLHPGAQPLGLDDLGGVLPPRPVLLPAEDETAADGHREQGGEDDRGFRQVHNPSP